MQNTNKDGRSMPVLATNRTHKTTEPTGGLEQALFVLLDISPRDQSLLKACAHYDCHGDVLAYVRKTMLGMMGSELQTLGADLEGGDL